MNASIHFHDQSCSVTVEINDEAVDDLLATKVPSTQLIAAKPLPEHAFLFGHLSSQLFGTLNLDELNTLSDNDVLGWGGTPPQPLPGAGRGLRSRASSRHPFSVIDYCFRIGLIPLPW
jgi:hypothetical protein